MKRTGYLFAAGAMIIAVFLTSGCIFIFTSEDEDEEGSGSGTGFMQLYVSDAPADIDDFDVLNVTFEKVRIFREYEDEENWTERDLDRTVDLTGLKGPNATRIANLSLDEGNYTKIELYVEDTYGTVDGEETDIFVPSDKLMITKDFEIEDNETARFVFDINVVKRGMQNEYNLLPVISESGVVGEDLNEDDFEEV